MNSWIELDKHPEIMNSLIEIEGDCLLLFDNGDVCKFSDKEHPFAIVTHFKSLTADDEQKRKAAPVMYEALRKCADFAAKTGSEPDVLIVILQQIEKIARSALSAAERGDHE